MGAIVLYDGVCGFCTRVTQFLLPRDKHNRYRFATLQSDFAKEVLNRHDKPTDLLDTFYLVIDHGLPTERLIARARAGIRVAAGLGGIWSLLFVFLVIPSFIANPVYDFIARNRYRWFGKTESCMIPRAEWRHKFIA